MLTDQGLREAINKDLLGIEPFADNSLQPASYDMRVGKEAFVSGTEEVIDVENRGLVIIDSGEFAVVSTREEIRCGPQIAGQLGLTSDLARQGLVLLSGPQIDPGFAGVLVVRMTNLSPRRITLRYEAPFLTVQLFDLGRPVAEPYRGSRQNQTGLRPADVEALTDPQSPTLGGMVKSLQSLASDVGDLKTAVKWMGIAIPVIVTLGIAIIAVIVALK